VQDGRQHLVPVDRTDLLGFIFETYCERCGQGRVPGEKIGAAAHRAKRIGHPVRLDVRMFSIPK
jgi:hypothetical protein